MGELVAPKHLVEWLKLGATSMLRRLVVSRLTADWPWVAEGRETRDYGAELMVECERRGIRVGFN